MTLLEKNVQVLKKFFPGLYENIKNLNINGIEVIQTKTGLPNIKINDNGKEIFLHSNYDPQKEAFRLIDNFNLEGGNLIVVFGLGFAYHLYELQKKLLSNHKVIIIEPRPEVFKAALENIDLTPFLQSKQFAFYVGKELVNIEDVIAEGLDLADFQGINVLEHPPSYQLEQEYYNNALKKISEVINQSVINLSTHIRDAKKWHLTNIENLPYIVGYPGIKGLFNKFKNNPAVIISAGPSLDKNIEYLRLIQNRALLISMGTSLKPLISRNIHPHFVLSIDSNEANFKHFAGVKAPKTYLAAESRSLTKIIEEYEGPKLMMTYKNSFMNWMEQFIGDIGTVQSGGSVATVALDMAMKLGCNPIIFVGQDLALAPNGRSHASGTVYEDNICHYNEQDINYVKVPGYFGGEVVTLRNLRAYLSWIESFIAKNPNVKYINATEGGAKIEGTEQMPLKEVIIRYCSEEITVENTLKDYYSQFSTANAEKLISGINKMIMDLKEVENLSREALKVLRQTLQEHKKLPHSQAVQKGLYRVGRIDQKIDSKKNVRRLVNDVLGPILTTVKRKGNLFDFGNDETLKNLELSREIYENLDELCSETRMKLEEAVSRIKPITSKGGI